MRSSTFSSAMLVGCLLCAGLALWGCDCHEPTVYFYEGFEDCDGTCGWEAAAGDAEQATMLTAGEHGLLVRRDGARRHFGPGDIPPVRYLQLSVLSDCWYRPGGSSPSLSWEIAHDSETLLSGAFTVPPDAQGTTSCNSENDCYPTFERLEAEVETTRAQIAWLRLQPSSVQGESCRIDQVRLYEWDEAPEGMDRCGFD